MFDRIRGKPADPANPASAAATVAMPETGFFARIGRLPRWALGILAFMLFAAGWWGIGGAIVSDTDADVTMRPGLELLPPGGSVSIATAAMLIRDAVDDKGWTPNDGIFSPTALLEDMPAFQRGEQSVLAAFADALKEATDADPDVADAAEALQTPPDRGWLHSDFPFIGGSAESRYSDAAEALTRFNRALAESGAPAGGARQLRLSLAAIDRALATSQHEVDAMVDGTDTGGVQARYHQVRGAAFAATMLMRGLRDDHDALIRERQLAGAWAEAIEALDSVAGRAPFGIGRDDLVEQGYFLLRARESLRVLGGGSMP